MCTTKYSLYIYILYICYTSNKSLKSKKKDVPRLHCKPSDSESLGVEPGHQFCFVLFFKHSFTESNVKSEVKTIPLMNRKCIHSFIHLLTTQTSMTNYHMLTIWDSEAIKMSKAVSEAAYSRQRIVSKPVNLMW